MKKLIFSTVLMLLMVLASYGKPASKNMDLVKGLTSALQNSNATSTFTADAYKKTTFAFKGKTVSAFYDTESEELIGFSIPMNLADLSQTAAGNIKANFGKYTPEAMIMFIRKDGYFAFYVSLSQPRKPSIAVRVEANDQVYYHSKI